MPNNEEQKILEEGVRAEAFRQELLTEQIQRDEDEIATEEQVQFENEVANANQLAAAQKKSETETTELYRQSQSFSGPSLFKYAVILLLFALPNDVIDLFDLIPGGMIVSWLVSSFLSFGTIIVTWLADSELQRVNEHIKNVQKYQQAAARTMTRVATKLIKFAPRNPVVKVVAGMILEFIPIISILPWSSICVFLAYQDEKHSFKEVREQSKELLNVSSQVPEMV